MINFKLIIYLYVHKYHISAILSNKDNGCKIFVTELLLTLVKLSVLAYFTA